MTYTVSGGALNSAQPIAVCVILHCRNTDALFLSDSWTSCFLTKVFFWNCMLNWWSVLNRIWWRVGPVLSHHSAPSAAALAERLPRADPVQAGCSGVQVSARDGTVLPRPWAPVLGRFWGPEMAALYLIIVDCPSYTTVHCRWSVLPVAAARSWTSLPRHVTSAPSMSVFFFKDAWRLSCSGVPFHESLPQLL